MAVNERSIIFGGVNSADFGIYIYGDASFDAPKRAVEEVSVPGRNGALLVDQGRWENIEVTYPAFYRGKDWNSFATQMAAFRNALCAQVGYQRLMDTFNDNEYRMAVYKDGLDVNLLKYNSAARFDLKFTCKPQRYLLSGEAQITVADGETLVNPTLYDAHPLLAVEGYGTIGFNGYEIEIEDATLGRVRLAEDKSYASRNNNDTYSFVLDTSSLESGDAFSITMAYRGTFEFSIANYATGVALNSETVSGSTNYALLSNAYDVLVTQNTSHDFVFGTAKTVTASSELTVTYRGIATATPYTTRINITLSIVYDGTQYVSWGPLAIYDNSLFVGFSADGNGYQMTATVKDIIGVSTQPMLGHPTYIDCDLGEAYKYEGDTLISLNRYIALGSDLPCLAKGGNLITADSTITEIKLTPRWWIL